MREELLFGDGRHEAILARPTCCEQDGVDPGPLSLQCSRAQSGYVRAHARAHPRRPRENKFIYGRVLTGLTMVKDINAL